MNLSPLPIQKFFSNDGVPLAGGLLFTYAAGTATKIATWQETTGSVLNTNPIVLDFRGECRVWLDPTLSYKFVLAPSTDTDPPGNPIWTVDNIAGSSASSDNAAVDTGSPNTVRLAIPALASTPAMFDRIVWKSAFQNTGATTVVLNGGLAKNLLWQNRESISPGALQVSGMYEAIYDGTAWQLQGPTLDPTQMRTLDEFLAGATITDYSRLPGDFLRYGALPGGDAATNAAAINDALLSNSYCFCNDPGTYVVNTSLLPQSNQTIRLAQGVIIQAGLTGLTGAAVLQISECENVQVYGGVFDGNKSANPAGTIFGVRIFNSKNVKLFGVVSQNFPSDNVTLGAAGDGFYVGGFAGGSPGSSNIELHGCTATGNVRQGLSIVRADGVSVIGGSYSGTTGNNPGGGIDIEANPGLGSCRNIRIVGVELADNYVSLILTESSFNVLVSGCSMLRSRSVSLQMTDAVNAVIVGNLIQPAMTVSGPIVDFVASENVVFSGNYIEGQGAASSVEGAGIRFAVSSTNVSITNNTFKSTRGQALSLGNSGSTGVPTLINFSDNVLIDCLDPVSSPARGSIAIGGNTGSGQFPLLATVRNNIIYDTRGTPADFGITLTNIPTATSAGYRIDGNRIQGPVTPFSGSVSTVPPLCGVVTWNPGNLLDGAGETSPNITVTGAALGDAVEVYPPYSLQGFVYSGYVSAADTVVVRIQNETTGTVDLASGSWRVRVRKLLQY